MLVISFLSHLRHRLIDPSKLLQCEFNPLDHPHASQAYKVTLFTQQELMKKNAR